MAVVKGGGRGLRAATGVLVLLSVSMVFSACWLFPQPSTGPVNDVVALVGQSSGGMTAGVHVFHNGGQGILWSGPVLTGTSGASSGYTALALGNIADHAAPSSGGPPVNDIFVTNDGQGPNQVWINNGSGTFTQKAEGWGTQNSTAVALGPILGVAGEVDAFIANGISAPTIWQNGFKNGSFSEYTQGEGVMQNDYTSNNPQYAATPYHTDALGMGNLAGSTGTNADIFTGNDGQQNQLYEDTNSLKGTYQNTTQTPSTASADSTQGVAVADLNGDGLNDVFVANDGQNYAYFNSSGTGYNLSAPVPVGSSANDSTAVALGKLAGKGTMYAFVVNSGAPDTVWKYNGSGGFSQVAEPNFTGTAAGTAVALGDLNGDGIPDAVVASGGKNGTISVWVGNGDGTFTEVNEPNIPSGDYVAVAIGRLR